MTGGVGHSTHPERQGGETDCCMPANSPIPPIWSFNPTGFGTAAAGEACGGYRSDVGPGRRFGSRDRLHPADGMMLSIEALLRDPGSVREDESRWTKQAGLRSTQADDRYGRHDGELDV